MSSRTRILIIKLSALGDVLRSTCALPGLRTKYKNSHITWVTSVASADLLRSNPFIDEVLYSDNLCPQDFPIDEFELLINLDEDPWACEFAALFPQERLIGAYIKDGNHTYTESSAKWFDMSLISRYGQTTADRLKKENRRSYPNILFEMLQIPPGKPTLFIPYKERRFAEAFSVKNLRQSQPTIGLNTSAGSRWRYKQLSQEKTADLINKLSSLLDTNIILFGGYQEQHRNNAIHSLSNYRAIDSGSSNSLIEFAALIDICDLLITSDSLALHIASCVGVPTIPFFGPTSPYEIELFSGGIKIVPTMECISCYKTNCDYLTTCMDNVLLSDLINATKTLLA